jgi:hypothetical protein
MRKITITGAQAKGFKLNEKGDAGFLTVVATIFKNKTKRSLWFVVQLKDNILAEYQKNPITGGVNVEGEFNVSSYTDNSGNLCPKIAIKATSLEANEGYGSGLLTVRLTKIRLADELRISQSAAYAKMVQNNDYDDKAMWCDASFYDSMKTRAEQMKLKKGSTCDLDAEFDVQVNEKDGKQYLNILLNVISIVYAALPPKTTQTPAPQKPPVAEEPVMESQPAPSTTPVAQETTIEESELSGEPSENDFF